MSNFGFKNIGFMILLLQADLSKSSLHYQKIDKYKRKYRGNYRGKKN
jgi:hypothetical protein